MARRRFEMHHHRQALLRMRQGDSDRDIAAARVMGRPKAAQWRHIAQAQGWLDPENPLCRTTSGHRMGTEAKSQPRGWPLLSLFAP